MPPRDHPVCPDRLYEYAREKWESVVVQLDSIDLLSSVDTGALELYCPAYRRYRYAEEIVKNDGEVTVSAVNKYPVVSPYDSRRGGTVKD